VIIFIPQGPNGWPLLLKYGHLQIQGGNSSFQKLNSYNLGDFVPQGENLGTSNDYGVAAGAHLHFEVQELDPYKISELVKEVGLDVSYVQNFSFTKILDVVNRLTLIAKNESPAALFRQIYRLNSAQTFSTVRPSDYILATKNPYGNNQYFWWWHQLDYYSLYEVAQAETLSIPMKLGVSDSYTGTVEFSVQHQPDGSVWSVGFEQLAPRSARLVSFETNTFSVTPSFRTSVGTYLVRLVATESKGYTKDWWITLKVLPGRSASTRNVQKVAQSASDRSLQDPYLAGAVQEIESFSNV
jgi:hypothetical protein